MDAKEQRLTDAYNKAVDELNKIPKGDIRHFAAAARVVNALKALHRYRQRKRN
jgi:hypothetical protein